jgi:hypothetical protein
MAIELKDFPISDFEKIGIKKNELLNNNSMVEALKSGFRSPLMEIKVPLENSEQLKINAKLSLKESADGSINLYIHPIRRSLDNDLNLTTKDINKLKEGETLIRPVQQFTEGKELRLIQLDKENNELLSSPIKNIYVADRIQIPPINNFFSKDQQFVNFSTEEKEVLKKGELLIKNNPYKEGEQLAISINLNSPKQLEIVRTEAIRLTLDPQVISSLRDKNQNGIPDKFDSDINRNGIPDIKEKFNQALNQIPSKIGSFNISDDNKRELLSTGRTTIITDDKKADLSINSDFRSLELKQGNSSRVVTTADSPNFYAASKDNKLQLKL